MIGPYRASRRTLYRSAKKLLERLVAAQARLPRTTVKRAVRRFLRRKRAGYLLRVLRHQAFALAIAAMLAAFPAAAEPPVELAEIHTGTAGFALNGEASGDSAGWSVSGAGDVNGDGIPDVIVAANGADPNGSRSGKSYVVFGREGGAAIELSSIAAGTGGFAIEGEAAGDDSGFAVSGAGDVNNDGKSDVIVGSPWAGDFDGKAYVVFGKADGTTVQLSDVAAGNGGFVMSGGQNVGLTVSDAGDLNNDGYDDVLIESSGVSYLIFGKSDGTPVNLSSVLNGHGGGFIIVQEPYGGSAGIVSGAGDVNGDGTPDILIGAYRADAGDMDSGKTYVVFGKSSTAGLSLTDIAAGTGGFVINGEAFNDRSGYSVSGAGDVNGDGLDDIVIGAILSDVGGQTSGRAYVVFGKDDNTTAVELSAVAAGTGGFAIDGENTYDSAGRSVSGAGDVNGDGLADVIVGANGAPNGDGPGRSYVVFGKTDSAVVDLGDIADGIGGFALNGESTDDEAGIRVSGAGDIDGDGLDDVVIGAFKADPSGTDSGKSYVVFSPVPIRVNVGLKNLETGLPVTNGRAFIERNDGAVGFPVNFAGLNAFNQAVWATPVADNRDYILRATSSGFAASDPVVVSPDDTGLPVAMVELAPDNSLDNLNILRVIIDLQDASNVSTGTRILTKTAQVRVNGSDLGLVPMFGRGELIFLGVPVGEVEVFVPDQNEMDFTPQSVTLGSGVDKTVTIAARQIAASDRSSVPAIVVGSVLNAGDPALPGLEDAMVIATNLEYDLATFTRATVDGDYVFPDIIPGDIQIRAYTSDGAIRGTLKRATVGPGEQYGDDPQTEDTLLTVSPGRDDSDGDGLPDDFEELLAGQPADQQTPEADPDGDGLSNFEELLAETDPVDADSDNDGFNDAVELAWGSNPQHAGTLPTKPGELWVDFGFNQTLQVGTLLNPLNNLEDALNFIAPNGTIRIKGDVDQTTGPRTGTAINQRLTLEAFRGTIRIQ